MYEQMNNGILILQKVFFTETFSEKQAAGDFPTAQGCSENITK
ncbi:hypothetical protein B425_2768 [Bacillus amyloliquefaciens]|nr:hypothetical protein B425_2768 [Bacillus amyloliquefaciens]